MVCTFFGHRDVPKEIEPTLRSALIDLIVNKNITLFYVGNNGGFDNMVIRQLKDLSKNYSIEYYVVLAYMPCKKQEYDNDNNPTILPEGIETVPRRFAISYRNKWMLKQSDVVVTYVRNSFGGAAKFKEIAEKQKKNIVAL